MVVFWVRQNLQTLNQVEFMKTDKAEVMFVSLSHSGSMGLKKIVDIPLHMNQHHLFISVLMFFIFEFK